MSGIASAGPAAQLFRGQFNICFSVYDTRRGTVEGHEADKVLAFYPPSTPEVQQSSIVGLAQALTMFAGTFSKEEPFHSMEAENNRWVMFNCEPDIWLLMILNKAWIGPTTNKHSLQTYLHTLHAMFLLLHGSLINMLEQDPTAHTVRRKLQPFLQEAAARLLRNDGKELSALSSPLGMAEGCPFLPLSRASFTTMQTLVNDLLISTLYGARLVHGALVCYEQCLLWSTLSCQDTHALYHLAARTLLPAARAGLRHKQVRRPAATGTGATLLSTASWEALPTGASLPVYADLCEPSSRGSHAPAGAAEGLHVPSVWLQRDEERCLLLPVHAGPLVLLLLVHEERARPPPPRQGLVAGLLDMAGQQLVGLGEQLAAELPAANLWHAPGVRYLYQDALCNAVRASPLGKVGTLSSQSLALAADVRAMADFEADVQAAHGDPGTSAVPAPAAAAGEVSHSVHGSLESVTSCSGRESDVEVVCKGAHDCWVTSRRTATGRKLAVVMEGDKEGGILGVHARTQQFCDKHFPGVFDGIS